LDSSEKIVYENLLSRGFNRIKYEPDGNVPPDFLINGTIAVEVRRLNQNHFNGVRTQGLEEVAIPLWQKIGNLVVNLGPPIPTESWFVSYCFNRPLEPWKNLEEKICTALNNFAQRHVRNRGSLLRQQNFELDVLRASNVHKSMFIMGGFSDRDSGGWVLSEMEAGIRYCADEKSKKISGIRKKYARWWLIFVDHIGYGLDEFDREIFREKLAISHDWDKIFIVDPLDPSRYFEV
jgi:hypothetical protein